MNNQVFEIDPTLGKKCIKEMEAQLKTVKEKKKMLKNNIIELNKAWYGSKGTKKWYESMVKRYDSLVIAIAVIESNIKSFKTAIDLHEGEDVDWPEVYGGSAG